MAMNLRRARLKRRGVLAAAAAAVATSATVRAQVSSPAAGAPLIIGGRNRAGAASTALFARSPRPALEVKNFRQDGVRASSDYGVGVDARGVVGVRAGVVEGPTGVAGSTALLVVGPAAFTGVGATQVAAAETESVVRGVAPREGSLVVATAQAAAGVFAVSAWISGEDVRFRVSPAAPPGGLTVAYFIVEPAAPILDSGASRSQAP